MPSYKDLEKLEPDEKERAIKNILKLREALKTIPERTQKRTLILATWNIREFDSNKHGPRMKEAIYYIAEIIAKFDIVALQEVNTNLDAFNDLMDILGDNWAYIITDATEGTHGFNERLAFVYDTRKVKHRGLAGELVLEPKKIRKGVYKPSLQLYRTPLICGFTAGWCDFMLATVHIQWGKTKSDYEPRRKEIEKIAKFLKKRTLDETAWARNLILLGDFNIWKPKNKTFKALTDQGFEIPEQIRSLPSNIKKERHYDQIAFRVRKDKLTMTKKAGIFDFYKTVYQKNERLIYEKHMPDGYTTTTKGNPRKDTPGRYGKQGYYEEWRTFQMSDHYPMWVELVIDYSDEYLKKL